MKATALQYTSAIVHDNEQYIDGNIAEYLLDNLNYDESLFGYLTDDEIENGDHEELKKEVAEMIKDNFDFDISKFEYFFNH